MITVRDGAQVVIGVGQGGMMRVGYVRAAVMVVGVLSGCAGDPSPTPSPLTAEGASVHYGVVLADVRGAVDDAAGPLDWSSTERSIVPWDVPAGSCPFWSPEWQAEDSIAAETEWPRVVERLEPLLVEHGFEVAETDGQGVGGWAYLKAEDARGVVLSLRSKSHTEVNVSGGSVLRGAVAACPAEGHSRPWASLGAPVRGVVTPWPGPSGRVPDRSE